MPINRPMGIRFSEDGGIKGLFGRILQGSRPAQIGDLVQVRSGETLLAPPPGRMWHQPAWAPGLFSLADLVHHPIFEVGDVFGLHPEDPVPLPPSGTRLLRIANPSPPEGETAAVLYKIVAPPAMSQVMALPKPTPPTLQAHAIHDQPRPEPGRKWQVLGVDGRNLQNVMGAMVAA